MMNTAYVRTLKALRRELDQVEARAAQIRTAISSIEGLMGTPNGNGTRRRRKRRSPRLDAIEQILREAGKPLHVEDIMTEMQRRGAGGADRRKLKLSVVRSLDRKHDQEDRFVKTEPATYFLRHLPETQEVASDK